ncbi:MAG: mobilization protein, partial [Bacteroides uniformis]
EILKVQGSVIGTLGNFSASIGKAKSKKTFNVSAIVAAALKNGTVLNYTAELPENKRKILYVDTEQSTYHCEIVARRSLRMAGLPTDSNHENLEFLVLRKYTPEERIAIVREAIYRTENVGLVVIDGIRDMVYDINSSSESTKVISLLMTWTGERNIHIHTETVLQVEKDEKNPGVSTVKTAHIRAVDFEPFAFRINGEALPELLEDYQFKDKDETKGNRGKFDPYRDITEQQHRIALEAAFTLKDEYGYKELEGALREAYASVGVKLSDHRLRDLITVLKNKRMIVQENGRKYTFKPDFHY